MENLLIINKGELAPVSLSDYDFVIDNRGPDDISYVMKNRLTDVTGTVTRLEAIELIRKYEATVNLGLGNKFKIGEKVKLNHDYSGFKKGTTGVVVESSSSADRLNEGIYRVDFGTRGIVGVFGYRLEKAEDNKEKETMGDIPVGTKVRLTEQGKKKWASSPCNPRGIEGTTVNSAYTYMKYRVEWDNGERNSYDEGDIEAVPSKIDLELLMNTLTKEDKKELKKLLDSEDVVLYSVAGRKWGKKQVPESKLKMSYRIHDGEIKDIKVESI